MVLFLDGFAVLTGCREEPEAGTLPLLAATNAEEITVSSAVVNGTVLANGYFLASLVYDEYQAVELWTFTMTSDK
ncbi:MAG: hypothetical protein WAV93_02870 [Bacteroidales bacterium]